MLTILIHLFQSAKLVSNKNDARDAEAIAEAITRPTMRFVPKKTIEQQDILIK
jgi:transposase